MQPLLAGRASESSQTPGVVLTLVALALALVWWWLMSLDRFERPFRKASARVQGHLLEVLLYGAFPRVMLRSLAALTRACAALTLSLLPPCLLFTFPLLVGLAVASGYYEHRPANLGEPVLVRLEGNSDWQLQPGAQFAIEASFRYPSRPLQVWRLRPLAEGELGLEFRNGTLRTSKSLRVADEGWTHGTRNQFGWAWLMSPFEPPLPEGLRSVTVLYPPRVLAWNGYSAPWWLLLLLAFLGWSWLLAAWPPGLALLPRSKTNFRPKEDEQELPVG